MAVTNPKPKILLVGKLRAGKSLVAHYLVHQYGFHELAFGSALKRFAHDIFWASETDGKPRALYQQFGELCRRIDPMVWVRFVDVQVDVLERSLFNSGIVVSDGRQPHEVEWARNKGFVIVRVSAPDEVRIERALRAGDVFTDDELSHETEQYVGEFEVDYEIVNDGTVDDLQAKVDELMSEIKRKGAVE